MTEKLNRIAKEAIENGVEPGDFDTNAVLMNEAINVARFALLSNDPHISIGDAQIIAMKQAQAFVDRLTKQ